MDEEKFRKASLWIKNISGMIARRIVENVGQLNFPATAYPVEAKAEVMTILSRVPEIENVEMDDETETLRIRLRRFYG